MISVILGSYYHSDVCFKCLLLESLVLKVKDPSLNTSSWVRLRTVTNLLNSVTNFPDTVLSCYSCSVSHFGFTLWSVSDSLFIVSLTFPPAAELALRRVTYEEMLED